MATCGSPGQGDQIARTDPDTGEVALHFNGLTPNSYPLRIAAGPGGSLWFTEYDGNRIGKIALTAVPHR